MPAEVGLGHVPGREEDQHDDAHRLLRVVEAVRQRVRPRRDELQLPEDPVHLRRGLAPHQPVNRDHVEQAEEKTDKRRQDDERRDLDESGRLKDPPAGVDRRSPGEPADDGVRRRRGKAQPPGDEVPGDRPDEPRGDYPQGDRPGVYDPFPDGGGDPGLEEERGDKIEECGPEDGVLRFEHPRRYDGGDGVGGVVEAVDEIEDQRQQDQEDDQRKIRHFSGRSPPRCWRRLRRRRLPLRSVRGFPST